MKLEEFKKLLPFEPYDYQEDYFRGIDRSISQKRNYLVTLPTGTGKSLAFEYCANKGKTIYTVPIRALADEKLEELPKTYPRLRILRDTGADFESRSEFDYTEQDVIITTNERLLSMMNTAVKDKVFEGVDYIVFDEIHMIGDTSRGATLEWIIMLLKRFHPDIFIVGLSATLPNYRPFADWLNADYTYLPNEARPIPLKFFFGEPIPHGLYGMSKKRDYKFSQLLSFTQKYKEQFLVFLSSKRDIEKYAKRFAGLTDSATLKECMANGVAWHHADIEEDYKKIVLDEFKDGNIRVIFCSPTLAVGVNLPATNCVIFDMSYWNDISFQHIPLPADKLAQMFGRAGRVGYSDVGRVIILGDIDEIEVAKYHIEHPSDVESQFGRVIVDRILNMISSRIATNIPDIYLIVKESFLYYQHQEFDAGIIEEAIRLLLKYKLIKTDDDYNYRSTKKGYMSTKLYISVHTIKDALHKVSNTKEVTDVYDLYRIFLGNSEFLGNVTYDGKRTDRGLRNKARSHFINASTVYDDVIVSQYDPVENKHVLVDKSDALLKAMAIMFKRDIVGDKQKVLTSEGSMWKMRKDGAGLVSRLSAILEDDLRDKVKDKELFKYMELSLKYGTLNSKSLELFQMKGVGSKSIEKLMRAGIDTKEKFLNTSVAKLKAYGVRNAESILKASGNMPKKQTNLNNWFN